MGGRLTQAERADLFRKFGGRCAYCGSALAARWHADHIEPVVRGEWIGQPTAHPERHRIDNLNPACAACNISKGSLSIEAWRAWIAGHVDSLNRHHSIYRLCKSFGLVAETGAEVVFHFEAAGRQALKADGGGNGQ